MLHAYSQGHRPSDSGVEDFLKGFTVYGRGGHLGHEENKCKKLANLLKGAFI